MFFVTVLMGHYLALDVSGVEAASTASLFLSQPTGTRIVGSVFTVSVMLNTGGQFVNAIEASLVFPPDKLQIVSPSLGTSIIGIWTDQPRFDNQSGLLNFQGGVPDPGVNVSQGVVATITFRVKSVGQAMVKFSDQSKVLLNDGLGSDILGQTGNGIYDLVLPPPAGPRVISETHTDQARWYQSPTVALRWFNEPAAGGYSYVLNQEPIDIPDDISEGPRTSVVYKDLESGLYFFHVKASQEDVWGDATHFSVKIDAVPPAKFPIEISPSSRTDSRTPLIKFVTTDTLSGIDHYELKIVPLNVEDASLAANTQQKPLFIEATSPYSQEFKLGKYQIIVRVYDKADNFQEISKKLSIVAPIFKLVGLDFLPRWLTVLLGLSVLIGLVFLSRIVWRRHDDIHTRYIAGVLKEPSILKRMREFHERRSKYKQLLILFLVCVSVVFGTASIGNAQNNITSPPIVTTIADNISNEELFYIGGKSVLPESQVIIYMQSLRDGQAVSATVEVDNKGDWFYSYPKFLPAGRYLVWTQNKIGENISAPSAQQEVSVVQTALQFGASRLSFETLYFIFMILFFLAAIGGGGFIAYHFYHARRKQKSLLKEIVEVEEALKRGFLVLRRDIQAELSILYKNKACSPEDLGKERQLLSDLEWVNKRVEKEIRDVERLIGRGGSALG